MDTKVVRIRREKGKIVQDCDIYIGRACNQGGWNLSSSIWCNPFSVQKYGREHCLELYRKYILKNIEEFPEEYNLEALKGKRLGCWCTNGDLNDPIICHGQVLMKIMKEKNII